MNNPSSILVKNVYYMLSYAYQVLHQDNYADIEAEEFEHAADLFAAILSKGIDQQLKQGLYRAYQDRVENLPTLHGKLDLNGTIHNRLLNRTQLSSEFDELTVNNLYNRILKTTAMLLIQTKDVRQENRNALKRSMLYFEQVETLDPLRIRWDALRYTRNNQSYRMLMGICRFVIEGLLISTDQGIVHMAQFMDEQRMSRLYEKFILEFYKKELPKEIPGIDVSDPEIDWAWEEGDRGQLPGMQSDIVLQRDGGTLIIDAKYYTHAMQEQYDKVTLRSAHIYQIFAYVKNMDPKGEKHVAGLLLYAKTDEAVMPGMKVKISGNYIMADTLDLNQPFIKIKADLLKIAKDYFDNQ